MSDRPHPSRQGAALLIVLATLVLAVTASATVARIASTAKARRAIVERTAIADDLLVAAEVPILSWLALESAAVVLPPEAATPEVEVLHDTWVIEDREYGLRITAWDQCGMVPVEVGRSGSPLRLEVPLEILRVVDRVKIRLDQVGGLDLFRAPARTVQGINVFPEAVESVSVVYGQPSDDKVIDKTHEPAAGIREALAVGAYVATHNPGRINVNTAPIELVERAMRLAGRGGIEQIVEARSAGNPATVVGGPATDGNTRRTGPEIAAQSTAWSFRIDTEVGVPAGSAVHRSWWAVYVANDSSWECVQRLAIAE